MFRRAWGCSGNTESAGGGRKHAGDCCAHFDGDQFYSFGVSHPGAVRLHNFPRHLQDLRSTTASTDLAAVDILRDRERGVPRYNQFRRLLKGSSRLFDELSDNPEWRKERIRQRSREGGPDDALSSRCPTGSASARPHSGYFC